MHRSGLANARQALRGSRPRAAAAVHPAPAVRHGRRSAGHPRPEAGLRTEDRAAPREASFASLAGVARGSSPISFSYRPPSLCCGPGPPDCALPTIACPPGATITRSIRTTCRLVLPRFRSRTATPSRKDRDRFAPCRRRDVLTSKDRSCGIARRKHSIEAECSASACAAIIYSIPSAGLNSTKAAMPACTSFCRSASGCPRGNQRQLRACCARTLFNASDLLPPSDRRTRWPCSAAGPACFCPAAVLLCCLAVLRAV